MREFNTSGPCDPAKHYTVRREALLEQGRQLVDKGRYFTIFAPRQSGKSTYFSLLLERLEATGVYTPVWISFENLKTADRDEFYEDVTDQFQQYFAKYDIAVEEPITSHLQLAKFFKRFGTALPPLVLVIDEFEGIPDSVLNEVMHTFRKLYHQQEFHGLHSLILVGISTMAELVLSSASPFNIVDDLKISYFTHDEVRELIQQYVSESGQPFEEEVIEAIYEDTKGQPGLVCALCHYLVNTVATERSQAVSMQDWYTAITHFTKFRRDKNILNIVQKAKEKREFMLRVLFSQARIEYSVDHEEIDYLSVHGVIGNVDGYVGIPVPLYRKRLINAFRPVINGEVSQYMSAHEGLQEYISESGLNMHALLLKYRQYVRRRGFRAFDTQPVKEAAWHYSLDGFINFFIEQLGGHTFIETPAGRGCTDIVILYHEQKYVIEVKVFTTQHYFQKGKGQLADYLTSEGLDEGFYVVFSNKHTEQDTLLFDETVNGKRISTYIILTQFEQASKLPVLEAMKA